MMLSYLRVKNLAVIEELELHLAPGFNVLTGESGSGKSVLVTALALATGARADGELVRSGTEAAEVDAVFHLKPAEAEALGLEEEELILHRTIFADRRSLCRVDDQPVPLKRLRAIGHELVEFLGQGEGFRLRQAEAQLHLVDAYAENSPLLRRLTELKRQRDALARRRALLGGDEGQRRREEAALRLAIQEIEAANPVPGEEEELRQRLRLLAERATIRQAIAEARLWVDGGEREGALDLLAKAERTLGRVADRHPRLEAVHERLAVLVTELQDLRLEWQALAELLPAEDVREDEVIHRLTLISDLKRKYGPTLEDVVRHRDEAQQRLAELAAAEAELAELGSSEAALAAEQAALEEELAKRRHVAGAQLARLVTAECAALGLRHAELGFRLAPEPGFVFTANPDVPAKPLAEVASGGELHRLLLAFGVVARPDGRLWVFDEIDTGIGGEAAKAVADRLERLARTGQILVVTHQAVLAARAERHIHLNKHVVEGRTEVRAEILTGEARLVELARLLSGTDGEAAIEHAWALLVGEDERQR